jgi:hypothetical protein
MMMRATTMTTDEDHTLRVVYEDDVRRANRILFLDATECAKADKPISALSFVSTRFPAYGQAWSVVLGRSVDCLIQSSERLGLAGLQWIFYGASHGRKQRGAVTSHKKFWGDFPDLDRAIETREARSPQVEFAVDGGVRFGVAAVIDLQRVRSACEWIRATQSGFLLLAKNPVALDERFVVSCHDAAGSEGAVVWPRLVRMATDQGFILCRCSGAFDDVDAAVDIYFDARAFPSLKSGALELVL